MSSLSYTYEHNSCALCGLGAGEGMRFMFCSKCRIVVYCSKDHQVSHWKRHKRFCRENVWRRGSPQGVAAAAACTLSLCACKKWNDSPEIPNGQQSLPHHQSTTSNSSSLGYSISQYTASGTLAPVDDLTGPEPDPGGSSNVYTLNVHVNRDNLEEDLGLAIAMPVQQSSLSALSFAFETNESSLRTGYENTTKSFDGDLFKSHLALSGSGSYNNNSYNNGNLSTTTAPTSSSHPPPQEDLENHAPAFNSFVGGSGSLLQIPTQSSLSSPGGNNTGPLTSSLGPGVCLNNSSTLSSLSQTTKPHHQYNLPPIDSQGVIAENNHEDREGSTDENLMHLSTMTNSSLTIPFQHRNNMQPLTGQTSQQTRLWMLQVWKQVIEDLNRYGVCVVDNLLGDVRGASVLREVQSMYSSGAFQDGQLVKGQDVQSKSIRGDKITWVDGREPNCKNIAVLIKILDNIVMGANNVANNGKLGSYTIKERSKAMVACYPGSGTHYVKHVDNPNDDGRCVTAIYYLNKDWNTRENGGLLRIFPEGWSHQVADIEPLFDRVIFFWSDRRNPHEVQPAFKTRYAITLWYFDSKARARAKLSSAESNKLPNLKSLS